MAFSLRGRATPSAAWLLLVAGGALAGCPTRNDLNPEGGTPKDMMTPPEDGGGTDTPAGMDGTPGMDGPQDPDAPPPNRPQGPRRRPSVA